MPTHVDLQKKSIVGKNSTHCYCVLNQVGDRALHTNKFIKRNVLCTICVIQTIKHLLNLREQRQAEG